MHHCALLFRYPGSVFTDHVLRYQDTPGVEMIVVLGEVSDSPRVEPCCFRLRQSHCLLYRSEAQRSTRSVRPSNEAG